MSIAEASSPRSAGPADDRPTARARFTRARLAFRHWRWQRPFWAGLFTLLAGLPIAWFPYANLTMGELTIRIATTAGSGSLVIGALLITLGLGMWLQPATRVFAGVATIMLSLVSLVVSNFGGFIVGFLLGLIGGGLSIAWAPGEEGDPGDTEHADDRHGARDDHGTEAGGTGRGTAPAGGDEGRVRRPLSTPGTGSVLAGFGGAPTRASASERRADTGVPTPVGSPESGSPASVPTSGGSVGDRGEDRLRER